MFYNNIKLNTNPIINPDRCPKLSTLELKAVIPSGNNALYAYSIEILGSIGSLTKYIM